MTDEIDDRGRQINGNTMLILLNARDREVAFTLPGEDRKSRWVLEADTARDHPEQRRHLALQAYRLLPRSMAVFRLKTRRWAGTWFRFDSGAPQSLRPHTNADLEVLREKKQLAQPVG